MSSQQSKQIEIHEFSTGINVEKKPDGTWFSKGFLGSFMNQTLDPIPEVIIASIRNKEFEIAEGASNEEPALIGREVGGESDGKKWSVVAVVTREKDESRGFSAYRYFCCEGHGNISKIIRYFSQKGSGNIPVFNTLEEQTIGKPHLYEITQETDLPLENFQDLLEQETPVVISTERVCPPLVVNKIATILGEKHNQLVAWAYNVGGVQYPRSFDLIKPNSEKAERIIRKTLAEKPNNPQRIAGEEGIKTAIKTLANREKIKLEHLQTLSEALENRAITEQFWQTIFDSQGLREAKNQEIYTPPMIRLFTLQAIILPDTLPTFLRWLEQGKDKKDKKDDLYSIFFNFQEEILSNLLQIKPSQNPTVIPSINEESQPSRFSFKQSQNPTVIPSYNEESQTSRVSSGKPKSCSSSKLSEQIRTGVKNIITYLLKQPDLLAAVVWLLESKEGLWGDIYHKEIIKDIEQDLQLIGKKPQRKSSLSNGNPVIQMNSYSVTSDNRRNPLETPQEQNQGNQFKIIDLSPIMQGSHIHQNKQYLIFAELFSALGNYRFAAFFYHIAQNKVPKKVFGKVYQYGFCSDFQNHLYGYTIEREVDQLELFCMKLAELVKLILMAFIKVAGMKIPLRLVFILILLFSAGSIFGAKKFFFDSALKFDAEEVEQCVKNEIIKNKTQKNNYKIEEDIKECFKKLTGD